MSECVIPGCGKKIPRYYICHNCWKEFTQDGVPKWIYYLIADAKRQARQAKRQKEYEVRLDPLLM